MRDEARDEKEGNACVCMCVCVLCEVIQNACTCAQCALLSANRYAAE